MSDRSINQERFTLKYDVILADPPWEFQVWEPDTGHDRSAESYYSTMGVEGLCALPIKELAAPNCALFLWCVWPSIFKYVPPLLDAWGFEYRTLGFEWWKLNKRWDKAYLPMIQTVESYSWLEKMFAFGMGYYTRANSEPCLLAVRGSMPVAVRNERNFIIAPIQEHSRKPDEQYSKIEALYPNASYLELFARRKSRPGWHYWGNEIEPDLPLNLSTGDELR